MSELSSRFQEPLPSARSSDSLLSSSPDFLNLVLNSTIEPIYVKDRQHRFVLLNDAFCRFFDCDRSEALSRSEFYQLPEAEARLLEVQDEQVLSTEVERTDEAIVTNPAGNRQRISITRFYFCNERGDRFVMGKILAIATDHSNDSENENLRQSLHWLKLAIDRIPQAIFWKDCNSVYLGCNQKFAQIARLNSPEEIIGKTDRDLLWNSEDLEKLRVLDARLNETNVSDSSTQASRLKDSEAKATEPIIWLDTRKIPIQDELGNTIGILGTVEDITDRKQFDRALQKYSQELIKVFGTMQDIIFVLDSEGCILRILPTKPSALYQPDPELIGKTVYEFLSEQTAEYFLENIRATLDSKEPIDFEYSIMLESNEIWFEGKITPLEDDMVICVARDVTERKQAEVERTESELELQSILDYAPAAIFIKDLKGKYIVVNRKLACEILNLSESEVFNKDDRDLFPEEITQKFEETDQQVILQNSPIAYEDTWQLADGQHTYLTIKFPLKNARGETYAIGGIATDITSRKQAEETLTQKTQELEQTLQELRHAQSQLIQTEKMSSLGQLVAGIAHEVNNPVNFIHANLNHARGYLEELLKLLQLYQNHFPQAADEITAFAEEIDLTFLLDDLPKLLGSMQVGTQRIRNIVRSLQTFSRLDEEGMKRVDIHEGIESTLMMLQYRLNAKPGSQVIEIRREYGNIPKVECHAGQLNQVFLNILTNAIDALEELMLQDEYYRPHAIIRTQLVSTDRVSIHIIDNGPGICESIQKRIFDPFFTTKPVGKGTGIGMSISYQIVTEKHGGSLRCFSTLGVGAEFIVEIPIRQDRNS
jgi:PAS domain S-box-containing protein